MKIKWWNSLRTKIIAWSFVPTVIILSAVAWFTFYSYQKVLGDLAIRQDWAIAQSKAVKANTAIAALVNRLVRPIILTIDIDYSKPPEVRAQNILDQAQGLETFDGGIYFLDQQGKIFRTQPPQPELVGQDWSDTPQFRYLVNNPPGPSPVTDIRTIGPNENGIVCATWPMHSTQGEFIGAEYYCLSSEPTSSSVIYETFSSLNLGSDVYIIDGNQRIMFSPDPSQIGRDLSQEAYIEELLHGQKMSIQFHKAAEDMVISYYPMANVVTDTNRWILIKEQSLAEIMRPTLPYRQFLYILLALGVVVPVLVTAYGVRHITNPIQKLIHASEQVTAGQFQHRIEVKTGDEIETLAHQFNLMSAELDESYSSLEEKVADRTRELAIMNSIISVTSQTLNIQEILEQALNQTVEQLDLDAGAAFKLDTGTSVYVLAARQGFEGIADLSTINVDTLASQANRLDQLSAVSTIEINNLPEKSIGDQFAGSGFQLLIYVPLSTKGRNLGFFILGKKSLTPSTPEELSLLSSIGQQIGVAMENAHLYEQAEQTAIAAERTRLARELHDAVTQTLFSASLIADVIPRIWKRDPEEGMKNLEELRQLTRGALAEMRTLLLEMRPETLNRIDLKSLLTQLADAFIGRARVPVTLDIQGDCQVAHQVKLAYYRVAQEALNNIAKHSGARKVEIRLQCQPDRLNLNIKDDGLGFDLESIAPEHLGIAIMQERANSIGAKLKIESQPGQGTAIEMNWDGIRRDHDGE